MSAAKHTPGPWGVARRSHCTVLNALFVNGGGDRVARVVVPNTASSIEEYEANARLIAAAPELLEALQSMPWPERSSGVCHLSAEWLAWQDSVKAAIAKATGATT